MRHSVSGTFVRPRTTAGELAMGCWAAAVAGPNDSRRPSYQEAGRLSTVRQRLNYAVSQRRLALRNPY